MKLILTSIAINILLIVNFKRISKLFELYDYPDKKRKIHSKKVPLIGGLIIYLNFLILFILGVIFKDFFEDNFKIFFDTKLNFINFFLISTLIFFLGIFDDKKNLSANLKLFLLIVLVSILLIFDNKLILHYIYFSSIDYEIYTHNYGIIFTLLCFLLFINASNMYDGINLQFGPYCIFIFIVIILKLNLFLFSIIFIISLLAFCFLNYNGRVFIGNSGAYFLSFLIAYIFVKQNNLDGYISVEEIFLIMSIPGLDMFRLFISRILNKKNPFSADRKHLHHYMINNFNLRTSQLCIFTLNIAPFCFYQIYNSIIIIFITITLYMLIYLFLRRKNKNVS